MSATRDIKYRWVRKPGTKWTKLEEKQPEFWASWHAGDILRDVGILADGTLHNPNGYPEDIVRLAIMEALERQKKRRSDAAKRAAKTRAIRMEKKVYEVVQKIGLGHKYGPASRCYICLKGLDDPQSIERGIGSDCWQRVMELLSRSSGHE
jgi:Family of unknown function (DUF6011)